MINTIKVNDIGLMLLGKLFFRWPIKNPPANNDKTAVAINYGDLIKSLNNKTPLHKSSQYQSKLKIRSNHIVPREPIILYPLFLNLCFSKKSR